LWAALSEHFGDPDATPVTDADEPLYDLHAVIGPVTAAIDARFAVTPMTVLDNTELVNGDNAIGQAKRHVRVALPEGAEYQTGDHLTVLADNPPDLVTAVLELFDIDPEVRLSVNSRRSSRRMIAIDRAVSARELLTHFVELRKPVTRSQLRRLAASNPCQPERERLEALAEASDPCMLSPLECVLEFRACALTDAEAIELGSRWHPGTTPSHRPRGCRRALSSASSASSTHRPAPVTACSMAWHPIIWPPSPRDHRSGRGLTRHVRPSGRVPIRRRT
jgi:cytochrome P450/NADPH-cytochrome P450 reductase